MLKQVFKFQGSSGEMLAASLERPHSDVRGYIIFVHCFDTEKQGQVISGIARSFVRAGVGVVCLSAAIIEKTEDILRAVTAMTEMGMQPFMLAGHSLAVGTVLDAAAISDEVIKAVSLLYLPVDTDHALRQDILTHLKEVPQPVLILDEPDADGVASVTQDSTQARSFIALDNVDYRFSDHADVDYVAGIMSVWGQRYLPEVAVLPAEAGVPGVSAAETGMGAFQLEMQSGKHYFLADEPLSFGGNDTGPAPYDFLAAGLAACTVMTLRMYATQKEHNLYRASAFVACKKKPDGSGHIFERTIALEGELDDAQRARFIDIADLCPVHKTLANGAEIVTRLKE